MAGMAVPPSALRGERVEHRVSMAPVIVATPEVVELRKPGALADRGDGSSRGRERGRPPVLIVVFAFFAPSRFKCPMAGAETGVRHPSLTRAASSATIDSWPPEMESRSTT